MDPNETARLLLEYFEGGGDEDEAMDLLDALADWVASGGFPPASPHWSVTVALAVAMLVRGHALEVRQVWRLDDEGQVTSTLPGEEPPETHLGSDGWALYLRRPDGTMAWLSDTEDEATARKMERLALGMHAGGVLRAAP